MQVQDSFSVPRRTLDVEDYIDVARRHKGWIFGPLFAALVVSVVGAFLWPDTFVSSATIKVIPQVVPEVYVQSNVNQVMSDRIGAIAQTVLSRPVLTSIITTYDLYQRDRQRLPMEDVIENMRKDIKIGNVLNVSNTTKDHIPAFQIQFAYIDKYKAQKVVNDLVSKFIDQNQRERSNSSLSTTSLLRDQWDLAKKELDQVESKLAEFRTRNQGRLPDEMQQNLQQVTAVQQRMTTLNAALARVSQEKLMMESQVRIYKDQMNALAKDASSAPDLGPAKSERMLEAEREVRAYENHLAALRDHYKETYPDVQQALSLLNSAKKKRDVIAKDEDSKKPDTPAPKFVKPEVIKESRELEAAIRRVQSQIEAKDLESEEYRREMAGATNNMKSYQSRLDGIPASAKENDELTRNREMARAKFVDLDLKMNKALMAQDMENRKAGEYLEPLDPPSLPQTPTQPKRPMVIGIGAVIGLVLGILFAGGREMKDTSLKNLKDVRAYTKLPILGSVPLLENDLVVKRRRRFAWFAWSLACLTGIVVMSGSVIYYYATRV
jgi:polysaccharide chain length determinant protein (PEP-CTERM system associated)